MKLILDTHIFLWFIFNPKKIKKEQTVEIERLSNIVYLSSVSIAELMIKVSIGKINFDFNPKEIAIKSGFELLDFKADDALVLKELPFFHRDPFDRMLMAQSLANDYAIITNDKKFKQYSCKLI